MGAIQKLKRKINGVQRESCGTDRRSFIRARTIYTDRMSPHHVRNVLHHFFSWQRNYLV